MISPMLRASCPCTPEAALAAQTDASTGMPAASMCEAMIDIKNAAIPCFANVSKCLFDPNTMTNHTSLMQPL